MAREDRIGYPREHAVDDPIAQRRLPRGLAPAPLGRDAHRDAKSDDPRDVLGPRSPALLLPAAGLHRRHPCALADVQRTDALRPVELVRIQRDEVDGDPAHVELERADALHRVAVERDAAVAADRADLGERLQCADLIVRVHDRDERGAVVDRRRDRRWRDATVWRDIDHGQPHVCVLGEVARRVEDRVMLDRRRHEAIALAATRLQGAA